MNTRAILGYFLKLLVDHKAKDPDVYLWDKVKPGSDLTSRILYPNIELE